MLPFKENVHLRKGLNNDRESLCRLPAMRHLLEQAPWEEQAVGVVFHRPVPRPTQTHLMAGWLAFLARSVIVALFQALSTSLPRHPDHHQPVSTQTGSHPSPGRLAQTLIVRTNRHGVNTCCAEDRTKNKRNKTESALGFLRLIGLRAFQHADAHARR